MFTFTDNEALKKELKLFQVANDFNNITEICKKMEIIPQAYYNTLKKQGLSFNDIKKICDAMDADLCIEFKKRNSDKINKEKQAIQAQIAELQAKLKTI
jgi:hypothetical protein|nr:MAG TPA: CI repressor [Caudoviricetes sp.]